MDMSGVFIKVPVMQNGRCFPSSIALAEATPEQVKSHMLARRNATGFPIMACGTIDKARHNLELELASVAATNILEKLARVPNSNACVQRIAHGRVVEKEDLELLAGTTKFRFEVLCADDKEKPFFEVNGCNPPTSRSCVQIDIIRHEPT